MADSNKWINETYLKVSKNEKLSNVCLVLKQQNYGLVN